MRRCRVGPFDQQAYLASAREWQVKLISESGPQVAGVVTKCLTDFGFGQRPRFSDPKFRETIYKEVVEPLVRYRENWATASEN
ncbi:hypothetical protein F5X68DRAFT_199675 [Plectosphaerella plurivora]|uniref:Uncharacterized protein n=1 Tax=Plectosphaerella plurivora TaxID=936078 RepID=A0A9P8VHV6_9PEZI|nr:hypothetical protein F5X68DRAFT_199675 [Plectosphaerella plurivora]